MAPNESMKTLAVLLKRLTTVCSFDNLWYNGSSKSPNCDNIYKHFQKDDTKDNLIRPDWLELPGDNLEEILKKLDTFKDYLSVINVCKSWRYIAHNMNYHFSPFNLPMNNFLPKKNVLPMLLQPSGGDDDAHYLYSTTEQKIYTGIHVPELSNKWIVGSANGWLVTVDMNDLGMNLLNPLTRVQIQLPPVSSFQKPRWRCHGGTNDCMFVQKVCIFFDHVDDPTNCLFIASVSVLQTLSYCRIGDHQWRKLDPSIVCISDVIMYKGHLYAVDWYGKIFIIELNPRVKVTIIARLKGYDGYRHHLVELYGDLLLVVQILDLRVNSETIGFEVFKLVNTQHDHGHQRYQTEDGKYHYQEEAIRSTWKEMQDLDDQMLFLGYNRCELLDPCLYPGSKKNCIYFTDNCVETDIFRVKGDKIPHDIGLYNMELQKLESLPSLDESSSKMPSIWLSPNPW